MIKSNFREWTLDKIEETFELQLHDGLDAWLLTTYHISEYENRYLLQLQKSLLIGGDAWNEVELENKFISPLIMFADIENAMQFSYFLERELSAQILDFELTGRVDGMIATGFRNPKKPFFCINEYKRQTDPDGDPAGQCLIAMLVAQVQNENAFPIYGCYMIGKMWRFMILEGKSYTISKFYQSDDEEIFDIYRILKGLKAIIQKQIDKK
jgi:hypothetical protein